MQQVVPLSKKSRSMDPPVNILPNLERISVHKNLFGQIGVNDWNINCFILYKILCMAQ